MADLVGGRGVRALQSPPPPQRSSESHKGGGGGVTCGLRIVKTQAIDRKLLVRVTLVAGTFSPLFHTSSIHRKMRRCFTAFFRGDIKPSVPGDLARLAPGYSRLLLATTMLVKAKTIQTKQALPYYGARHVSAL